MMDKIGSELLKLITAEIMKQTPAIAVSISASLRRRVDPAKAYSLLWTMPRTHRNR